MTILWFGSRFRENLIARLVDFAIDLVEVATPLGAKTLHRWSRKVVIDDITHVLSTFLDVTDGKRTAAAARKPCSLNGAMPSSI